MQNRLETELMKAKEKHGPFKDKNEKMQREKALERRVHTVGQLTFQRQKHTAEKEGVTRN